MSIVIERIFDTFFLFSNVYKVRLKINPLKTEQKNTSIVSRIVFFFLSDVQYDSDYLEKNKNILWRSYTTPVSCLKREGVIGAR